MDIRTDPVCSPVRQTIKKEMEIQKEGLEDTLKDSCPGPERQWANLRQSRSRSATKMKWNSLLSEKDGRGPIFSVVVGVRVVA
jgi:hypothetical protein